MGILDRITAKSYVVGELLKMREAALKAIDDMIDTVRNIEGEIVPVDMVEEIIRGIGSIHVKELENDEQD